MNRTRIIDTLVVTAAVIVLSLLSYADAWAFIGKVSSFKGEVVVTVDGRIERVTQPGVMLNDGDMVQAKNGEAQITFNDGAVLKISPYSQTMIQERQEQSGVWIFKTRLYARRITCLVGKLWFKSGTSGARNYLQTPTAVAGIRGSDGDFGYDTQRSFLNMYSGEATIVGSMVQGLFQEPGITAAQRSVIFQRMEQALALKTETDRINAATPSNNQKALNTSSVLLAILNIAKDVSTLIASSNPDPAARQQAQMSLALANTKIATAEAMAAASRINIVAEQAAESASQARAAGDTARAEAAEQAAAQARAAATLAQRAAEAAQRTAADAAQGVSNGTFTLAQVENSARLTASIAAVVEAAASVAGSSAGTGGVRGDVFQQAVTVVTQQLVTVTQAAQSGDAARAEQAARAAAAAAQTTTTGGQTPPGGSGRGTSGAGQAAILRGIGADVAAGVDIATIIGNAVAAGMTVTAAVEAIIGAGADPGRVTYLAILANYPATDVINGAASAVTKMGLSDAAFQAQMTLIASTARQAGASAGQINSGLSSAGVSATIIANANAQAARNPAPVFGYTAPTPPAPPLTGGLGPSGGGGPIIGGSGIGAPPTKAASQTKP